MQHTCVLRNYHMMAHAAPYRSLEKALGILELLAERSPRGVSEVADAVGLDKSSVSRLLKALSGWGYAALSGGRGRYQVGPRVLALGALYLQADRLVAEAQPALRDLAAGTRASAHLAVAVGNQMLIVAKEPSPERIQVDSRVGGRIAPHASALGKVLLAGLPETERAAFLQSPLPRFTGRTIIDRRRLERALDAVRRRGYALESGEEHGGVGCIGAPVRDGPGRWVAAISVSGPLRGTPFALDRRRVALVVAAAAGLSRRMGFVAVDGQEV